MAPFGEDDDIALRDLALRAPVPSPMQEIRLAEDAHGREVAHVARGAETDEMNGAQHDRFL